MKSRNLYAFIGVIVASLFLFASCQKDDLLEPIEKQQVEQEISLDKTKSAKCDNQLFVLTHFLTKRTWTYEEVFHADPAMNDMLNFLFADLTFSFSKDGTYHIVIPGTGRDDLGTWEFVDGGQRILADKGMETEHFVNINSLTMREFYFTIDDPVIGTWSMKLKPINEGWHQGARNIH